jgi:hypothetical protein
MAHYANDNTGTLPYSDENIEHVKWIYDVSRAEAVDILRDHNYRQTVRHFSKDCAVINPNRRPKPLPRHSATVSLIYS